jgi:hypothetical protein
MNNDFGIAPRLEEVAFGGKFFPQPLKIVDFPIEDDPNVASFVGHWLIAIGRKINDPKPAMPKGGMRKQMGFTMLRSPITHDFAHLVHLLR